MLADAKHQVKPPTPTIRWLAGGWWLQRVRRPGASRIRAASAVACHVEGQNPAVAVALVRIPKSCGMTKDYGRP